MALVLKTTVNDAHAPLCSICIANFNGENLLVDCIESVLAQQGEISVEILVHDDASTDASVTLLRERYPEVILIESTENVGFCIANNRLAERARGRYLLLLNNDAALAPDALATLLECANQQHPQGILTLPQYDWLSGDLVDRGCLLDPFYNPVPNLDAARTNVAMVIGACLWIPRALWQELGGFPEWFESIAEDMYLCCRARLAGYPVAVTTKSKYRHRQGNTFGGNRPINGRLTSTYRRRRLSERNKTFVMAICTPTPWVWLLLPLHLLALTAEGLLLTLGRRDIRIWREIYLHAFSSLARQWTTLHRRRIEVQVSRVATSEHYSRGFTASPRKIRLLYRHGMPNVD
jgi:GT2 family glycosyltransferase